jgi:hypothetical protein
MRRGYSAAVILPIESLRAASFGEALGVSVGRIGRREILSGKTL